MEIGEEQPAITVEPVEDPFRTTTPAAPAPAREVEVESPELVPA